MYFLSVDCKYCRGWKMETDRHLSWDVIYECRYLSSGHKLSGTSTCCISTGFVVFPWIVSQTDANTSCSRRPSPHRLAASTRPSACGVSMAHPLNYVITYIHPILKNHLMDDAAPPTCKILGIWDDISINLPNSDVTNDKMFEYSRMPMN